MRSGTFRGVGFVEAIRIPGLTRLVLERHQGLRLCIAAFDSGRFHISEAEASTGWIQLGDVAVSPPLSAAVEAPAAGNDDWYFTPRIPDLGWCPDAFASYGTFSLVPASEVRADNPSWDRPALQHLDDLQVEFWNYFDAANAVTYVGFGQKTVVASRARKFLGLVENLCKAA